jgi:hypothetical protein
MKKKRTFCIMGWLVNTNSEQKKSAQKHFTILNFFKNLELLVLKHEIIRAIQE